MKFKSFILFLFCISIIACKDTSTQTAATETQTFSPPAENIPKIESEPLTVKPNTETPTLQQEPPLTAYAQQFYTNVYWHFEAAVVIKDLEKGKAYIGKWIKFNADNTLESGFYDGPVNTGNWVVDEGKNVLTIVENGQQAEYSEWRVKTSSSSDAIMIWIGTNRFNQNNTQIKLIRYHEKPTKDSSQ